MDRRIRESVTRGDILTFQVLLQHDSDIIRQVAMGSLNTVLHLAARFGHLEFAQEIVKTCPDMVSLENAELETCLHEACREGHLEIVKLVLEIDPWLIYKVNCRQESVLFVACQRGKVGIVDYLVYFPMLLMLEVDMPNSSLHIAASSGDTEIGKLILQARPDFAGWKNFQGFTPLHLACSKGHLDMARELLKLDSDLCLVKDNDGRTPLHCAAARGRINIIDEILSINLESAEAVTCIGQTILHVAVKNNQYETIKYLIESHDTTRLLNAQDADGNTVLHLAAAGKLTAMVGYLLKIGIEVNSLNRKGYTALDVIESDGSNSGALAIVPALLQAGAKRCGELSPGLMMDVNQVVRVSTNAIQIRADRRRTPDHGVTPRQHHHMKRARKMELQNEGLRNARKTVTIVAVLIATVTFAAGINPPGGFNQVTGKALRGDNSAFRTFQVCNLLALFLSVGVVNVLVSIIPFTRKTMMNLLSATHKVMWLSTLFMTAAYVAAIWTIMPDHKASARWLSVEVAVIGGGSTVLVFFGLGVMLSMHWHNKRKWRKAKPKKISDESPGSSISRVDELKEKMNPDMSSNSDVDSSEHGYHLY